MAFKMKGPSLYSSPLKADGKYTYALKKSKTKRTEGKLKKKEPLKEDVRNTLGSKPRNSFSRPDGSVNIPVNPNAPKVKAPKNNTSIKGKTQFEVDTKGVRNAIGKTINMNKRGAKKIVNTTKKAANKVKDYFTKR